MAVSIHTKRVTKPFMASVADIRTYVYGATYDRQLEPCADDDLS